MNRTRDVIDIEMAPAPAQSNTSIFLHLLRSGWSLLRSRSASNSPRSSTPRRPAARCPLSPQQSQAAIKTKPGLRVDLVAAEPLVADPVAIAFGPDGKLWVAEMADYPLGQDGKFEPGGRIVFLEDTRRRRHLRQVHRVPRQPAVPDRRAAVAQGRADLRGPGHPLRRGHRRRRQGRQGREALQRLRHRQLSGPREQPGIRPRRLGLRLVRPLRRATSSARRPARPSRSATATSASSPTPANSNRPPAARSRAASATTGATGSAATTATSSATTPSKTTTCGATRTSPTRRRGQRRRHRTGSVSLKTDAQRFKLSGPPNTVTAACGLGIYRDDLLGKEFYGNSFTCEPVNLLVTRLDPEAEGLDVHGPSVPPTNSDREFLASTDNWFRPVHVDHRPGRRPVGRGHVPLRDRAPAVGSAGGPGEDRPASRLRPGPHLPRPPRRTGRRARGRGSTSSTPRAWSRRWTAPTAGNATWR